MTLPSTIILRLRHIRGILKSFAAYSVLLLPSQRAFTALVVVVSPPFTTVLKDRNEAELLLFYCFLKRAD
jgi:hypothetical protein